MNRFKRLSAAALVAAVAVPLAFAAHTHLATPSTWTLNIQESNFGTGPAYKSATLTMTADTEERREMSEIAVTSDGATLKTSYSGSQDGHVHPIVGMAGVQAGYNAATDTSVFTFSDGRMMNCNCSLSFDKKKYTERCLITFKDGKTTLQKLVYDRTK